MFGYRGLALGTSITYIPWSPPQPFSSMKRSRDERALKRKSTFGREVAAGEWAISEWGALVRLLLPLDLLLLGWALALHAWPARVPTLLLVGCGFLIFLALLIQSFAWVTVIAFFARERARDGLIALALLGMQLGLLLVLLWLAAPALRSRSG